MEPCTLVSKFALLILGLKKNIVCIFNTAGRRDTKAV